MAGSGYSRHNSGASRKRVWITRRTQDGSVHMQRSLPSSSYPARSTLSQFSSLHISLFPWTGQGIAIETSYSSSTIPMCTCKMTTGKNAPQGVEKVQCIKCRIDTNSKACGKITVWSALISIDLFTNVSQIYGCFFPRNLGTSHFINLYLTMLYQYLGIHFAYISCCYIRQTSDKLSGCQEQPLLQWYA